MCIDYRSPGNKTDQTTVVIYLIEHSVDGIYEITPLQEI